MRVDLLTREYPPHIYGGAGVHVAELAAVLKRRIDIEVRAFDGPRDEAGVTGYEALGGGVGESSLDVLAHNLPMANDCAGTDLVHSHTWYANMAGHLAAQLHDVPHVLSAHSLEPMRPWKAEQLGGGYRVSSWIEQTAFAGAHAIIAVSEGMSRDILRSYPFLDPDKVHVVHNGIDLDRWQPLHDDDLVRSLGVDPNRPSVVFVGRITRQKGLPYLLRAAAMLPPDVQLVLCAGSPDTPDILREVQNGVAELQASRDGVVWIERLLSQTELRGLLTAATTFVCPSVYEPLGIVNLEAMACGAPVVGTATGGIPEVVDDGVTGVLVPIAQADDGTGTPLDPDAFVADLAAALTRVVGDPASARAMGEAGRRRAEAHFAWDAIAVRTREVYDRVMAG